MSQSWSGLSSWAWAVALSVGVSHSCSRILIIPLPFWERSRSVKRSVPLVGAGLPLSFVLSCLHQGLQCPCCIELYWVPTLPSCRPRLLSVCTNIERNYLQATWVCKYVLVSVFAIFIFWAAQLQLLLWWHPEALEGVHRSNLSLLPSGCVLSSQEWYILETVRKQLFEFSCRSESFHVYVNFTSLVQLHKC